MHATWRPIATWTYPPRTKRPALFKTGWARTLKDLDAEIEAMNGREVIIGIVADPSQIRIDGQPKADFKVRHPGAEVSFEVEGGRRLAFHTDAYNLLQYNLRAIGLGLAALRAVDRYGIADSGEQFAGFAQLASGGPNADRGRGLVSAAGGLAKAMFEHHPDHGGQARDFADVIAYRDLIGAKG